MLIILQSMAVCVIEQHIKNYIVNCNFCSSIQFQKKLLVTYQTSLDANSSQLEAAKVLFVIWTQCYFGVSHDGTHFLFIQFGTASRMARMSERATSASWLCLGDFLVSVIL